MQSWRIEKRRLLFRGNQDVPAKNGGTPSKKEAGFWRFFFLWDPKKKGWRRFRWALSSGGVTVPFYRGRITQGTRKQPKKRIISWKIVWEWYIVGYRLYTVYIFFLSFFFLVFVCESSSWLVGWCWNVAGLLALHTRRGQSISTLCWIGGGWIVSHGGAESRVAKRIKLWDVSAQMIARLVT